MVDFDFDKIAAKADAGEAAQLAELQALFDVGRLDFLVICGQYRNDKGARLLRFWHSPNYRIEALGLMESFKAYLLKQEADGENLSDKELEELEPD